MTGLVAFRALAGRQAARPWSLGTAWFGRAVFAGLALGALLLVWSETAHASSRGRLQAAREAVGWLLRAQLGFVSLMALFSLTRSVARERESGTMELLLLAPLHPSGLLLAKMLGRGTGLLAELAATAPALLACAVLGGVSAAEIATSQIILLGALAAAGGVAAFFSSVFPGTGRALAAGAVALFGWWALAYAGFPLGSAAGLLEAELEDAGAGPADAALGCAVGAAVLLAGCALGGAALRRASGRGAGPDILDRASRRLAEAARRWKGVGRLFRPLRITGYASEPVLTERPPLWRLLRLAGLGALGVGVVLLVPDDFGTRFERYFHLGGGYGGVVLGVIAIGEALSAARERRSGRLEALLAANVEPDVLLRARELAALRRGALLSVPALVYIAAVLVVFRPGWDRAGQVLLGVVGFAVALGTVAVAAQPVALAYRRGGVAAAVSLLSAWPLAIWVWVVAGSTLWGLCAGALLWIPLLLTIHAWTARHVRRRVLA